jgi:YqaJ-like viral recombinase domain
MTRNLTIVPGSPEHRARISPSKVASICGVSRWQSAYSLWLEMKGLVEPEPPKDIYSVGLAFELALAQLYRIEHPDWRLSPGEVQFVTEEFGFPVCATPDRRASRGSLRRVVEFKIAHDTEEWGDPTLAGDVPTDYAVQVMAQMMFCGYTALPAHLCVMTGWFKHHVYEIEYDATIAAWMLAQCRTFWQSLQAEEPPELDQSVSTYRAVRELHPEIDYGVRVEVPEALAMDYRAALAEHKSAEATLRGLKSKILATVGSAQLVTCNGEVIAARQPHAKGGIALVAKG